MKKRNFISKNNIIGKSQRVSFLFAILLLSIINMNAQSTINFSYTGGSQTYTVPLGVNTINFNVVGASGGTSANSATPGKGGSVSGTLTVVPGSILYLYVGGAGSSNYYGGFNGGGNSLSGVGGGGASDIRIGGTSLTDRVVVAGGGGSGGSNSSFGTALLVGGHGGNLVGGGIYPSFSGNGGNQTNGGLGGVGGSTSCWGGPAQTGSYGMGASASSAGAGGGGFYGGGAGLRVSNCASGGGGGGSSMVSSSVVTNSSMSQGVNSGNGYISLTIPALPTVLTQSLSNLSTTGATLNGSVNDNGSSTNMSFEYSTSSTLSVGVVTVSSVPSNISSGSGNTPVSASINGIFPNTTYYYRLTGSNSIGTSNGNILNFTTQNQSPNFIAGSSYMLQLCQNSNSTDITPHLHVSDIGNGQTETWSVAQFPNHGGQLTGFGTLNSAIGGGVNISPSNSVTYTPAIGYSGAEVFAIQVSDGISSDTITFHATILPSPTPVINQNGTNLITGNYITYQWYLNGTSLSGMTSSTIPVTSNGLYTVKVTDSNGCVGVSNPFNFQSVGIEEMEAEKILNIYPNPSNGHFSIKINSGLTPERIEIYSSIGNKISSNVIKEKQESYSFDLTNKCLNGIYFLKMKIKDKILIKPILIGY